jgi:uridine kinase
MFADELAAALGRAGRPVLRASVDDFHRPRAERYRRGRESAVGYWLDAYTTTRE